MPIHSYIVYGCIWATTAELNSWDAHSMALKAPNIYCLALCSKRLLTPSLAHEMWGSMLPPTVHWDKPCYPEAHWDTYTHCYEFFSAFVSSLSLAFKGEPSSGTTTMARAA